MMTDFPIQRSPGVADGRSSGSGFGPLVWAVATSDDKTLDFQDQALRCFSKIDRVLGELGTEKRFLLSVTVYLSSIGNKDLLDQSWNAWVGSNPQHWPQRACIEAVLSRGTLIEISVIAARPS
jgi:enamine deaminase RidA (YjgF/YER057c/UK114 family)